MFLHLGDQKEINIDKILLIVDYNTMNSSIINAEFVENMKKKNLINILSDEETKSIVMVEENGKNILYFSPITSLTLQKRMVF